MSDEPVHAPPRKAFEREQIPEGPIQAVVWRVFNLGLQANPKGEPNFKCIIYFETNFRYTKGDYKGKRALVKQEYLIGVGPKAYLRRDSQRIIKREFTEEESKPGVFDFRSLEGMNCTVNIVHRESNGEVYNNVDGVMSVLAGTELMMVETDRKFVPPYVQKRLKERLPVSPGHDHSDAEPAPAPQVNDDDIPF